MKICPQGHAWEAGETCNRCGGRDVNEVPVKVKASKRGRPSKKVLPDNEKTAMSEEEKKVDEGEEATPESTPEATPESTPESTPEGEDKKEESPE